MPLNLFARKVACTDRLRQAGIVKIADDLCQTLVAIAGRLGGAARHDWWVIASAAVALHGGDPGKVGDVDVLLDPRDVPRVFAGFDLPLVQGQPAGPFRSDWFGCWAGAPLPVELFAGFALHEGGAWNPVLPATRQAVRLDSAVLYVPTRAELKAMLLRFGRSKDMARAATL